MHLICATNDKSWLESNVSHVILFHFFQTLAIKTLFILELPQNLLESLRDYVYSSIHIHIELNMLYEWSSDQVGMQSWKRSLKCIQYTSHNVSHAHSQSQSHLQFDSVKTCFEISSLLLFTVRCVLMLFICVSCLFCFISFFFVDFVCEPFSLPSSTLNRIKYSHCLNCSVICYQNSAAVHMHT